MTIVKIDPETEVAFSRSWAPEVIADSSGKWAGNGVRFPTRAEAEGWVLDRSLRWAAVRDTRVVPSKDPANYRWVDGRIVPIKPGDVE